jgi:hypothetical protein
VFQNEELKDHLETSFSVESQSAVVAEWNMNVPGNILKLGNYRYRENSTEYSVVPNTFDISDDKNFYTGATNSDVTVASGFEDQDFTPQLFTYPKDKEKQLYSLEECLKPFRPRSGINKLSYFSGKYLPFSNSDMYLRPRYYMPTKDDEFKYWRSYRTESNLEFLSTSIISNLATVSSISIIDGTNSTAIVSNLSSVDDLVVGKKIIASQVDAIFFSNSGTVQDITSSGSGVWNAKLVSLSSTVGLRIGDQITATAGTGSLFGGTPQSVSITSVDSATSISYRVVGGTAPTQGTVANPRTVPGDLMGTSIKFGNTATVGNIVSVTSNNVVVAWDATLTGLSSTFGLFVGDQITAAPGTGSLFRGAPESVLITAINSSTSISYRVVLGAAGIEPSAGTVINPTTVVLANKINVLEIINSSSILVSIFGGSRIRPGTIRNVLINKYNINEEFGISKNSTTNRYVIEDCNPFVVYKEPVPANRIVLKVQTNIGSIDLGPFRNSGNSNLDDPFFGEQNKTVPTIFKLQYLDSNDQWLDAYEFNESTVREDTLGPVFGPDGYLSLEYGIEIPQDYKNNFVYVGELESDAFLPEQNFIGTAYLVISNPNSKGILKIWNGLEYDERVPVYRWFIGTDGTYENTHFVTDFTNPSFYNEVGDGENTYREFVWMKGLRVLVETMSSPNTPLELIEISPRLVANLSESLIGFDVTKAASDLSGSALPVGQLMAGIGNISLFDSDNSFNPNNEWDFDTDTGSIIAKYINKNIKFVFYEVIKKVNSSNYYVPIKTMYSETFPERDARTGQTSIALRDFYFYFESLKAPRILITEASLSQAVCLLLDSVGFSNYVFKRLPSESDPVIPYFFIPPDQSVAETLANLARATQSAMFFDEFNNFIVMTKAYLLDESVERIPDATLYGSDLMSNGNVIKPANIIAIESKDRKVYNAGTVNYTTRYIQRTGGTIAQSKFVDKNYVYLPSLLWEVGGDETTRSANNDRQDRFALSALPLNTNLSDQVPSVSVDRIIINNTLDVGENAYWLPRFQGFLYSNSEIIRYDAVEFTVTGTGNVWISSNLEYQKYFSKIPFNGKMYPTGLIRIYSEPFFETITGVTITENNQEIEESVRLRVGEVVAHGRGQFGTKPVNHSAGLDSYWSDNKNVQGCDMDSSLLYTTDLVANRATPSTVNTGPAGLNKAIAEKTQRNGIIKNFLSSGFNNETDVTKLTTAQTATIQSSALVMTGPDFVPEATPRNAVSYVYKKLDGAYKHFGTRVRIIGKVEASPNRSQSVVGGMTYFSVSSTNPQDTIAIGGGSAGINLVNPETNIGYYFEIAALTSTKLDSFIKKDENTNDATISIENILFYKVAKNANTGILGSGSSVLITSIDSPTSISYRITGGSEATKPVAGTLGKPATVPDSERIFGKGTVSNIVQVSGSNVWDAKLTITSDNAISALRVGDRLVATPGTGKLFRGTPDSVKVISFNATSKVIDYRVTGGSAPKAGTVTASKTVIENSIELGETGVVQQISQPENITFGTTATVEDIILIEDGSGWQAKLTGLTSTSGLEVGYNITATAGTGKLFDGSPSRVAITEINNSTSITYRVIGGSAPVAGTVTSPKTDFSGIWDARLTGLTSTTGLRVGDKIRASAGTTTKAVPVRLWGGTGNIIVDDGNFAGQNRFTGEENPTVYDLAIEYVDVNESRRDFYLYINQTLVQRVTDTSPVPLVNQSVGLFVRGNSKAMFENIYALSKNYATNSVFDTNVPIGNVFGDSDNQVTATEALRKYAISGAIQNTYLTGAKPNDVPDYSLYFDEFGTILRECAYFNVKYDRAYPALYAKIAPTFNRVKGYTVSGFTADSYGAEFLVFNNTDTILNLDEKTGNYLRILGIAFTQNTTNSLTVDDYLKKRGNLSDPELKGSDVIQSPFRSIEQYEKVKQSRILYGKNDFSLDSLYIQDQDTAEDILGWIIEKNIRPRKSVGLKIFSMPILQLGDVVNINYKDNDGIDLVSPLSTKYVVYNINYAKSIGGPEMTVYLSEV